jgi:hypothetical protein
MNFSRTPTGHGHGGTMRIDSTRGHAGDRINSFVQPIKRPAVARVDANLLPTFPIDLVDNSRFPMFR